HRKRAVEGRDEAHAHPRHHRARGAAGGRGLRTGEPPQGQRGIATRKDVVMSEITGRVAKPGSLKAVQQPTASSHSYVILLSAVAALGGFLFGFDSAVINGTVDALAAAFGTRAATTGFAVASVLVGCAIGAFTAGRVADIHGRRPTMILNAVIFLISAFATGAAPSAGFFIASRLLGGVGIGAASVLAPMYIAEVAPAAIRGRLASLQQMA